MRATADFAEQKKKKEAEASFFVAQTKETGSLYGGDSPINLFDRLHDSGYTLEKYYCAANIHFDGIGGNEQLKEMWFSSAEKEIYQVYEGDLLVVEGGAGAGGCAIVKELTENVYVQNSIMIVRSKDLGCNSYLRYYIESLVRRGYIDIICNKATIPHFTKVSFSWYEKSGDQTWRSPCEILLVETHLVCEIDESADDARLTAMIKHVCNMFFLSL